MFPHKISSNSLTFFGKGRMWSVPSDHPAFEQIKDQLRLSAKGQNTLDMDGIIDLYDNRVGLVDKAGGRLSFIRDVLCFDGEPINTAWSARIERAKREGRSFGPYMKALEDLIETDNKSMIERLPIFVDTQKLGFLPDGRVCSFLVVRDDHHDVRRDAPYFYTVGSMREEADDVPLLVGSIGYLLNGQSPKYRFDLQPNRKIMLVAFKPSDAIGLHSLKMRVKKLEVIDEMDRATIDAFVQASSDFVEGYGLDAAA